MKPRLPKTRRGWISLILCAIALLAALAFWLLRPEPGPTLVTSPVSKGDLQETVEAIGTIEAYKIVSVGARASGQIKSLKVELGDTVKTGDLIAEIDSRTQRNDLDSAKAELENIKAQRAQEQATLKEAQLAFARQRQMLDADATSRADYESAEATLNAAKASIDAFDAQIEKQQTEVDSAQANLDYTRITAPMDGTVVAIVAEEGQTVNAAQSTPTIVKVAKLDTMTVTAEVSEADVIKVKGGQKVYFTILGDPDKKYHGKLRTIEPAPSSIGDDDSTSTSSDSTDEAIYYNALFDIDNPDGVLRVDMTAQVTVVLNEASDVLNIPSIALGPKGPDGKYVVRVVGEDGRPVPRRITIGLNNNASVEVKQGLKEGEKVVVSEAAADAPPPAGRMPGGPPAM